MNKIYKVMYSKVKQCAVVVSEIAKSHGHNEGRSAVRRHTALTAAVLVALGMFSFLGMPTARADGTQSLRNNDFVGANEYYWYFDEKTKNWTKYPYWGSDAFNNRSREKVPNYLGGGAKEPGSFAGGLYAQAGQETITIGDRNAGQSKGSVFIGEHSGYNDGGNNDPSSDSMKNNYVTAVGFESDATGWGSIAIGSNASAVNTKKTDQVVDYEGSAGTSGTVKDDVYGIKKNPTIEGASVALGYSAKAQDGNIAIGSYSDTKDGTTENKTAYTNEDAATSYVSVGNKDKKLQRRITNVADGADATDVATVGQLQALSKELGGYKAGFGIKIDPDSTDTTKNTISLNRNLGRDMDSTDKATLEADANKNALVLGGRVEEGQSKKGQVVEKPYGAFGQDSVVVGGANNIANKNGSAAVVVGGTTNTASAQYSTVVGGNNNDAFGNESSVFGGFDNDAFGSHATLSGGSMNRAYGEAASVFGGGVNSALGASSVAVGGLQSTVNGAFAVGIAGGSTNADYALAAGNGANVTVENGTAIGYQATTDEAGTIAFGHDVGDVSGYTIKWKQRTDGKTNADGTTNDYTQAPESVVAKDPYTKAAYNRLVKVADGQDPHDVVVMEQLDKAKTELTKDLSVNAGWGIDVAEAENGGKTISLERNLGNNSTSVTQVSNTGLILGGDFSGTDQPDEQPDEKYGNYGATGQYAVTLGGRSNRASGESSVAAGGMDNTADGNQAFVGGGSQNTASGRLSSAIGGAKNTASGLQSSAFGGSQNTASGQLSSAIGGDWNTASGFQSSAIGGDWNTASGDESSAIGGLKNIASGWQSSAFGGTDNISHGMRSSTLGGMNSVVLGNYATGIAGGSTGSSADFSLAAGSNSVVTVDNGTAIGYQATTNEEGTIAFGHDKGDISGYTVTWKQKATSANGKYYDANGIEITKDQYEALRNPNYTFNDYSKDPTITENTHKTAAYNRLVKVHDGKNAHDAVVMEQLKPYTKSDASNIGSNLKTYTVGDDGETITETDATEEQQKDNKDAWGLALGAGTFTTGTSDKATNASTSDQLVTGSTLYDYDKPTDSQNYVKVNNTTGQNLSALDAQVKANAVTLNDKTHNIKYYSVEDKISDDKLLPSISGHSNEKNDGAKGAGSMAAGFNTHADGIASTVAGSYSGVVGTGLQGATALSYGTFNVNQNTDTGRIFSGVANSIVGQANATTDSNAAIIYGAGNTVTNSYRAIDPSKFDLSKVEQDIAKKDVAAVAKDLQEAVPTSGGQVMVMGGGNSVENAYMTQVTGVGNTVTGSGTEYGTDSTQLNYIEGFYTKLENGKNDYIIGAHNTVTGDTTAQNQSNIVFGDNHKLTNTKNNLILGSSDTADDETTVSDVVSIGHNAKVTKEGGVAIGSGSEATTAAGVAGYDPTGATADTTAAWTSKKAAVSVGTADKTRQITGVAAGKEDTDAVNVAQLKKLNGMKANVAADNIGSNLNGTDEEKTNNEKAWATAIGNGDIATPKGMLVTDTAVHNEVRPTQDGTYVKASNTTAANLTALDSQVGTNTTDITNLKDLSNITDNGKIVVKKLASGAVTVTQGDRVTVETTKDDTAGTTTYKISANNDGKVVAGDTNLVSGDTVNTAITNAINQAGTDTDTKLKGKADINAGNIGANLNYKTDGTAVTDDDKTTNEKAWATAIGNGDIATPKGMLVTDTAVHNEVRPTQDGNYVKKDKTTGENLSALDSKIGKLDETKKYNYIDSGKDVSISDNLTKLDTQVKNNADAISKEKQDRENAITNITNNIGNLSDSAVKYDAGTNKGKVTLAGADGTTITNLKAGEVMEKSKDAVNGSQLYAEQKARTDADNKLTSDLAAETQARTAADTAINNKIGSLDANGNYIKKDDSISKNLSALDTNLKTTSDLIHTNTAGDTIQIGESSTATKIDVSGKDAKGNTTGRFITGVVTDAGDPTSAANVGYVNGVTAANTQQIYRDMNNAYGRLNNNINKAAAGSNALAALHPLDYDPDDKADFAVGYGHYRNANAAAVGAFYHPNENTMVNVGVSLGNGDPGFNAGVSFKIGSGSAGRQAMSKTEMAKVINTQSKEIDALKKDNADKDKRIDALEQKMAEILAKLDKNGK